MICIRPLVFHLPVEHLRRNVRLRVQECGRRTPRTGIVGTRRGGRGAKRSVLASGGETEQKIRSSAGSRDIYRGEVKAARHNRASTSSLSVSPSRILRTVCHILLRRISPSRATPSPPNPSAKTFDFVRKKIFVFFFILSATLFPILFHQT